MLYRQVNLGTVLCEEEFMLHALTVPITDILQKLSKSGNSLDFSSLTTSLDEIERRVHPQNKKYEYNYNNVTVSAILVV